MNKSIKVLVVINEAAVDPVCYSNKVDVALATEVRAACNELAIEYDDMRVEDITQALEHGRVYWIDETYCFDVIPVEL